MNVATEVYVKTTLVDKVLWHKVFVDQEERKNKSDTPLKFGVLANRMRKQYTEVSHSRDRFILWLRFRTYNTCVGRFSESARHQWHSVRLFNLLILLGD